MIISDKCVTFTQCITVAFILSVTNSALSQDTTLWLAPKGDPNNFNNNQYECPLWTDVSKFIDLEQIKENNLWIGIHSTIVRDINNDGYCDMFIGFFGNEVETIPFLLLLYNSDSGTFKDNSSLIKNNIGQSFNRKIVSADFNADGILDFVAASHPENITADFSYLDVVISNRSGWEQKTLYSPRRSTNQEGYFHGVSVGDVDNDGDIDIVVANFHDSEGQFTLLNDGQANFKRNYSINNSQLIGEKEAITNEIFDIDSDGCLDLIYAASPTAIAKIAYGTCDGYFGKRYQFIEKIARYKQLFSGDGHELPMDYNFHDFDKDGNTDLVMSIAGNGNWRLVFYKNIGKDLEGKVIFEESSVGINANLLSQGFYTDKSSSDWTPYIELLDINHDGYTDIIKPEFFDGNWGVTFYPQNWVLFGNSNGMFTYANYPLTSAYRGLSAKFIEGRIEFNLQLDYFLNMWANYSVYDPEFPLRGRTEEWIFYYSDKAFSRKSQDGVSRISISRKNVAVELRRVRYDIDRDVSIVSGNFIPHLTSYNPLHVKIALKDNYGVESPLSDNIVVNVLNTPNSTQTNELSSRYFRTFSPSANLNILHNNIGFYDIRESKIFSCAKIQTDGVNSSLQGVTEYSLSISVETGAGYKFYIREAVPFNPNKITNQNGKMPTCSGTFDTSSNRHVDLIQVDDLLYKAIFQLVDLSTLEMNLLEASPVTASNK